MPKLSRLLNFLSFIRVFAVLVMLAIAGQVQAGDCPCAATGCPCFTNANASKGLPVANNNFRNVPIANVVVVTRGVSVDTVAAPAVTYTYSTPQTFTPTVTYDPFTGSTTTCVNGTCYTNRAPTRRVIRR